MRGVDWVAGREDAVAAGDRVEIKFDLSRKDDGVWWSVTALAGAHKGKVVAYTRTAAIVDVTTHVLPGTQRAWAGKRRKPCAWLVGTLTDSTIVGTARVVTFDFHSGNPWFSFADSGERFETASAVSFTDRARAVEQ